MGVHDTDVYPEVKRLLGIPEDEPIFILRGQDKLAAPTVQNYANRARAVEPTRERPQPFTSEWLEDKDRCVDEFTTFATANPDRMKLPD